PGLPRRGVERELAAVDEVPERHLVVLSARTRDVRIVALRLGDVEQALDRELDAELRPQLESRSGHADAFPSADTPSACPRTAQPHSGTGPSDAPLLLPEAAVHVDHVVEAAVVALEGHGDVGGGAVAVLRHDEVSLAGAGLL